jgi:hypothetical protein
MHHLKTEKQMNNTRSVKTPTPPELSINNKSLMLPQQQLSN